MSASRKVTMVLTPAQARMVNAALAMYEAEDHEDFSRYSKAVMDRTREAVWRSLDAAKVEP